MSESKAERLQVLKDHLIARNKSLSGRIAELQEALQQEHERAEKLATAYSTDGHSLRKRIAQLEEALRKYARHKTHCGVYSFYGKPPTAEDCDCGYVQAMRAALSGEVTANQQMEE